MALQTRKKTRLATLAGGGLTPRAPLRNRPASPLQWHQDIVSYAVCQEKCPAIHFATLGEEAQHLALGDVALDVAHHHLLGRGLGGQATGYLELWHAYGDSAADDQQRSSSLHAFDGDEARR